VLPDSERLMEAVVGGMLAGGDIVEEKNLIFKKQ